MSCHICTTAHPRPSFFCPTCARSRLYQLRLDHGRILLEKDSLAREIEVTVSVSSEDSGLFTAARRLRSNDVDPQSTRSWANQVVSKQQADTSRRREAIRQSILALKKNIHAKKRDIAERKETLARRRSDAASAQYQLEERETALLTGVQNTCRRTEHLWHSLHSKTAEARIFLCREAAYLHGLRQKANKKNQSRPAYVLGGIPIVDLRDMNGT